MIAVVGVGHRYGDRAALQEVSFSVAPGELFGLLGPNGGGKSTLFRVLGTLMAPTTGSATIGGHDVVREAGVVRRMIGVVFQHPSLDDKLTVVENLVHHGRLHGVAGREAGARIDALLERFGLANRRGDRVETLSGGTRRRVELAKGMLPQPRVLLLDEPSAGLDPTARREVMGYVRELRERDGVTAVVTTHHMDEAAQCDRVAILDGGRLVAIDTPVALVERVGGDVVVVQTDDLEGLGTAIRGQFGVEVARVDGTLRIEHARGHELVRDLVDAFPRAIRAITFGKPTLDDVFVQVTGHRFEGEQP